MPEFYGILETVREQRDKFFEMFRIILVLWRQLDEQAAELPAIVQRKHQIGELVQFFLYWFSERFEQFMSYCLWKFGVENEVARRVSIPPYHHALFRKRVEGGIYFDGWEYLAVESELALG